MSAVLAIIRIRDWAITGKDDLGALFFVGIAYFMTRLALMRRSTVKPHAPSSDAPSESN